MAFARAVGEYGSVVFISGNMPMRTEITPLLIITKLDQYDYAGATAIAVVMLVVSFVLLLPINLLAEVERQPRREDAPELTPDVSRAVRRMAGHGRQFHVSQRAIVRQRGRA